MKLQKLFCAAADLPRNPKVALSGAPDHERDLAITRLDSRLSLFSLQSSIR
jgi:hypothetical protein